MKGRGSLKVTEFSTRMVINMVNTNKVKISLNVKNHTDEPISSSQLIQISGQSKGAH